MFFHIIVNTHYNLYSKHLMQMINKCRVMVMMFNATFNNISAISWRSALLVEDTGENHQLAASH